MKIAPAILLIAAARLGLAADWVYIASPNFEIYTNGGEREARQTLETFEQVRDFFMRVKSTQVTTRLPVTIVGFRSQKDYKPYSPNEAAAAYYNGDEQRDYIVMSDLGLEHTPAAIHEYMHLLVRHSGLKMPLWLNEGFAEVYSTLKPLAGQILLGSIPAGRMQMLQGNKWLPLPILLKVGHESADYNEKNRAGVFYSQSWALVHMLMLNKEYMDKFGKFIADVSATGSAEESLQRIYSKTLPQVDKDLVRYAHGNSLSGVLFKTKFERVAIDRARAASELDIGLTLAKLSTMLGHKEEAEQKLRGLAAANKGNFRVAEALAYFHWRYANVDEALADFEQALDSGSAGWKTSWDYARLAVNDDKRAKRVESALRATLESNPSMVEARIMLGRVLYRKKSYAQALATLREVKSIEPEKATSLFLTMAYCALELGAKDIAKTHAADARKWARDDGERGSADQLIRYLEYKDAPQVAAQSAPIHAFETISTVSEAPPPAELTLSTSGRLVQMDCLDGVARLHIKDGEATRKLLIRNPTAVTIRNTASYTTEMTCGPQNTGVNVEYTPSVDAKHQTVGDVRAIEFVK